MGDWLRSKMTGFEVKLQIKAEIMQELIFKNAAVSLKSVSNHPILALAQDKNDIKK